MEEDKYPYQCYLTRSWIKSKGVIRTIRSDANRPNNLGIKHEFGKLKGKLKKNKLITEKEIKDAISQN